MLHTQFYENFICIEFDIFMTFGKKIILFHILIHPCWNFFCLKQFVFIKIIFFYALSFVTKSIFWYFFFSLQIRIK